MKHPHPAERRLADPRMEAAASRALELRRGRAAIAAAPRAGGFAVSVLSPLLKESAATLGDLKRHWPEIVGDRLAGLTSPEKLAGGVLIVRAHASAAPFVQHQSALIMERARLAGARIETLQIRQGAPAAVRSNVRPLARPLAPEEEALLASALARIEADKLRKALLRLGRAVAAR